MKIRITCDYTKDTVKELPEEERNEELDIERKLGKELALKLHKEYFLNFLCDNCADIEEILGLKFEVLT